MFKIKEWIQNKPQFVPVAYVAYKDPFYRRVYRRDNNYKKCVQVKRIKDEFMFFVGDYISSIPGIKQIRIEEFLGDNIHVVLNLTCESMNYIMLIPINELSYADVSYLYLTPYYVSKAQELNMRF